MPPDTQVIVKPSIGELGLEALTTSVSPELTVIGVEVYPLNVILPITSQLEFTLGARLISETPLIVNIDILPLVSVLVKKFMLFSFIVAFRNLLH
jgi:hypothetical protein